MGLQMSSWIDYSEEIKMARKTNNLKYQFRDENHLPVSLEEWLKDPRALPIRAYLVRDEELPTEIFDWRDTSKYDGWEGDLVNQYD